MPDALLYAYEASPQLPMALSGALVNGMRDALVERIQSTANSGDSLSDDIYNALARLGTEERIKNVTYLNQVSPSSSVNANTLIVARAARSNRPYGNVLDDTMVAQLAEIKLANPHLCVVLVLITVQVCVVNPQLTNDGQGGGFLITMANESSDEEGADDPYHYTSERRYPELRLCDYKHAIDRIIFLNSSPNTWPSAFFQLKLQSPNVDGLLALDRTLNRAS